MLCERAWLLIGTQPQPFVGVYVTLRSTNRIESMISVCREHAANVKRSRDGQMALRWCAAGMVEAGKQFRRVNGHLHLPTLRAALRGSRGFQARSRLGQG
jgi:hypothetical protein